MKTAIEFDDVSKKYIDTHKGFITMFSDRLVNNLSHMEMNESHMWNRSRLFEVFDYKGHECYRLYSCSGLYTFNFWPIVKDTYNSIRKINVQRKGTLVQYSVRKGDAFYFPDKNIGNSYFKLKMML